MQTVGDMVEFYGLNPESVHYTLDRQLPRGTVLRINGREFVIAILNALTVNDRKLFGQTFMGVGTFRLSFNYVDDNNYMILSIFNREQLLQMFKKELTVIHWVDLISVLELFAYFNSYDRVLELLENNRWLRGNRSLYKNILTELIDESLEVIMNNDHSLKNVVMIHDLERVPTPLFADKIIAETDESKLKKIRFELKLEGSI